MDLSHLHLAQKHVPIGSATIQEDLEAMIRGIVKSIILVGLPLSGKSTIAQLIENTVHTRTTALQVKKIDFVGRTFYEVQQEGVVSRDVLLVKVYARLTEKLQQEEPTAGIVRIIVFPAFDDYAGKTPLQSIAEWMLQEIDGWEQALIWSIVPPDTLTLFARAGFRDKLLHPVQVEPEQAPLMQDIITSYLESARQSPPASRNIAIDENLFYYLRINKFITSLYRDREWSRLRNDILVPAHLAQAEQTEVVQGHTERYKTTAAYEVWRLYKLLGLAPYQGKIIANPQV